jgi:5-methylcytosine-specific restriction endonuclease McrA
MNEREKFRVEETKRFVFARDGYRCQNCDGSIFSFGTPQMGHRIAQSKRNIEKYGKEVIHHPMNLKSTCCLACNAAVSIGNHPVEEAKLVEEIRAALDAKKAAIA